MAKVYQNLSWAVAYNVVAIPIAAGVLLPQFDFAMTPSLSGEQHCTASFNFHITARHIRPYFYIVPANFLQLFSVYSLWSLL